MTNLFLIRYANKIRKNPELSPMYDLDQKNALAKDLKLEDFGTMTPRNGSPSAAWWRQWD